LPGASSLYRMAHQVVTLLDPAQILTPERVGGQGHRIDVPAIGVG
jgi:hypothetical protein